MRKKDGMSDCSREKMRKVRNEGKERKKDGARKWDRADEPRTITVK